MLVCFCHHQPSTFAIHAVRPCKPAQQYGQRLRTTPLADVLTQQLAKRTTTDIAERCSSRKTAMRVTMALD